MKKKYLIAIGVILTVVIVFFATGCHKRLYAQAVIRAIEANDDVKLEQLLSRGGDLDAVPYTEFTHRILECFNYPPLMLACERGNVSAVELLLQYGADPNTVYRGETALTVACYSYEATKNDIILLLLEAGADITHRTSYGKIGYDLFKYRMQQKESPNAQDEEILQRLAVE